MTDGMLVGVAAAATFVVAGINSISGQDVPTATESTAVYANYGDTGARNAQIIVERGRAMGVPDEGIVIAIATAMQESGLGTNTCCDHDSVGLFQQRPSMGWGSPSQVSDPSYASEAFYKALTEVDGWESMDLTDAAQEVQGSAHPEAYAKHEDQAREIARSLGVNA